MGAPDLRPRQPPPPLYAFCAGSMDGSGMIRGSTTRAWAAWTDAGDYPSGAGECPDRPARRRPLQGHGRQRLQGHGRQRLQAFDGRRDAGRYKATDAGRRKGTDADRREDGAEMPPPARGCIMTAEVGSRRPSGTRRRSACRLLPSREKGKDLGVRSRRRRAMTRDTCDGTTPHAPRLASACP
jgi:hypothetical protein